MFCVASARRSSVRVISRAPCSPLPLPPSSPTRALSPALCLLLLLALSPSLALALLTHAADLVYEEVLGDDKYTFVEGVKNPLSATILVKGPDAHTIAQLMDAVRDGTRAVANAIEDEAVVAGAGAFELACARSVREFKSTISGKAKLGVEAFAEAMLVIPKTLCENSGFDVMDTIIALQEEMEAAGADAKVGLDCLTGEPMLPAQEGVWDIARVKMQSIQLSTVIASQLLLVDELMRAGRGRTKG